VGDVNQWNASKPFNQLPALPPSSDLESKVVLKQCIFARAALAELRQAGELIPNQSVLINIVPLLEAKDSSEIENIVTTTDKLFQSVCMTIRCAMFAKQRLLSIAVS